MLKSQKLTLSMSKDRQRINELLGIEERSEDQTAELAKLTDRMQEQEVELRAAIVAEDDGVTVTHQANDAESVELRSLRAKSKVSDFVAAAVTGQGVKGESAEYAAGVGCPGQMPLDLLGAPNTETRAEHRAVTSGPAAETVTSTRPTVPAAFARTDAAALGIQMPMVDSGEAHYPALTTAPPAGMKAKDATADSTAAAFALTKREPGRLTGQFLIRVEDLALLPSMETDLRGAISARMADSLDAQVIDGDGTAPNLNGLFAQATDVSAAGAVETFGTGVSRFAALVDGTHANGWGDVSALIGTNTFSHYAGLFHGNSGEMSLYDYLMGKLAALRVSTRVPAVAGMAQKGIAVLGAQGQPVTVPVWRGVEMIVDPYTEAAKGQRVVTAVSLVGSPFIPYGTSQVVEVHPKLS